MRATASSQSFFLITESGVTLLTLLGIDSPDLVYCGKDAAKEAERVKRASLLIGAKKH